MDQILECLVIKMKASQEGLKATINANEEEKEANQEGVRIEMKEHNKGMTRKDGDHGKHHVICSQINPEPPRIAQNGDQRGMVQHTSDEDAGRSHMARVQNKTGRS
jgi:hypothetical protein